jgi:two-component system sensor histidine kinase/response regulator
LVDDELFFCEYLTEKFLERGYSIATVGDADGALDFVRRSSQPLVVLLDLMLPGISGLQVLRELAKSPQAPYIRVVLISAHQNVLAAAASHPMVGGRMQKPVDVAELTRLVAAAFAHLADNTRPPTSAQTE